MLYVHVRTVLRLVERGELPKRHVGRSLASTQRTYAGSWRSRKNCTKSDLHGARIDAGGALPPAPSSADRPQTGMSLRRVKRRTTQDPRLGYPAGGRRARRCVPEAGRSTVDGTPKVLPLAAIRRAPARAAPVGSLSVPASGSTTSCRMVGRAVRDRDTRPWNACHIRAPLSTSGFSRYLGHLACATSRARPSAPTAPSSSRPAPAPPVDAALGILQDPQRAVDWQRRSDTVELPALPSPRARPRRRPSTPRKSPGVIEAIRDEIGVRPRCPRRRAATPRACARARRSRSSGGRPRRLRKATIASSRPASPLHARSRRRSRDGIRRPELTGPVGETDRALPRTAVPTTVRLSSSPTPKGKHLPSPQLAPPRLDPCPRERWCPLLPAS